MDGYILEYPYSGLTDWERQQLTSATGGGGDTTAAVDLDDDVTVALAPPVPDDLVPVRFEPPAGARITIDGRDASEFADPSSGAILLQEGRRVRLELQPDAGAGGAAAARLGLWLRDTDGRLKPLTSTAGVTEWAVQSDATVVAAPAAGTRIRGQFEDQRTQLERALWVEGGFDTFEIGAVYRIQPPFEHDPDTTPPVAWYADYQDGSRHYLGTGVTLNWSWKGEPIAKLVLRTPTASSPSSRR